MPKTHKAARQSQKAAKARKAKARIAAAQEHGSWQRKIKAEREGRRVGKSPALGMPYGAAAGMSLGAALANNPDLMSRMFATPAERARDLAEGFD